MATQRRLTAGPSKFDLMASLFTGTRVTFTIEGLNEQEAIIGLVESEDGSFESWNIEGNLMHSGGLRFKGYFSTRRRQGHIIANFEETTSSDKRIPKNGDRAYTKFEGMHFEGTLSEVKENGEWCTATLVTNDNNRFRDCPAYDKIIVGFGQKIVWDDAKGMWHAPAAIG